LKSAVVRAFDEDRYSKEDIAASFQAAVVDCLLDRLEYSLRRMDKPAALVVAGGVAANLAIRDMLEKLAARHGMKFIAPPLWLCTDNGAMIAWAGAERFAAGLTDGLDAIARPRWPLDPDAPAARGAGVKA
jgi:N6-L-threonylcarbamoyladenine synthase